MARYGTFSYGAAKYGLQPRLAYSVEPMSLVVLDFDKTELSWQSPTGDFTKIRLVRSQVGYPETAEDGEIIWEEAATEGNVSRLTFIDPDDGSGIVDILPGKQIYYRVFLFIDLGYWVVAGEVTDTVPSNHAAQRRVTDIIPKVYTSEVQSPLGVTDTTSALYKFIEGMTFTYEQLLTQIDLLKPNTSKAEDTAFNLLPIETLNFGLTPEPSLPVKSQKRLVREAIYIYKNKGLQTGLETYAECLTGYDPIISVSPNLLLTAQDSTFYGGIGNWQTNTCTLTSSSEQVAVSTDTVIDEVYTGKVIASGAAYMTLGANDPIKKGIPVKSETDYTFGYKVKSPPSSGNVTLTVVWYDKDGTSLASDFVGTAVAANNTWKTSWQTTTSPADSVYASLKLNFSAAGTYYVDQVSCEEGENTDNTSYQEARAVDIFLVSNHSNFITNPSFETNTTGWTITADADSLDTEVPADIPGGTNSLLLDVTSGATIETTTATIPQLDRYYTLSFYAKSSSTVEGDISFAPQDNGTAILNGNVVSSISLSDEWQRYSVTTYVSAEDIATSLDFLVTIEFDATPGEDVWVEAVQVEIGPKVTDYFDGGLASQFGAVWEGTAHNSVSHLYYNKDFKIPRLAKTITEYLPSNTLWIIRSYEGVEYNTTTVQGLGMTDLLLSVVLTGLAVTYILELLDLTILGAWIGKSNINIFFALPLSFGGLSLLNGLVLNLVVLVPAATFVSLALAKYLNKPTVMQQRLPRLQEGQ